MYHNKTDTPSQPHWLSTDIGNLSFIKLDRGRNLYHNNTPTLLHDRQVFRLNQSLTVYFQVLDVCDFFIPIQAYAVILIRHTLVETMEGWGFEIPASLPIDPQVTHIYASVDQAIVGSDNGLSPQQS